MTFPNVNIIRGRGTPKKVTLWDGTPVYRKPKIYIEDEPYHGEVPCIDYDNHFIFEIPKDKQHLVPFNQMCSCGSIAVIVGSNQYAFGATPAGAQFVCFQHLTYGKHLDGSS